MVQLLQTLSGGSCVYAESEFSFASFLMHIFPEGSDWEEPLLSI